MRKFALILALCLAVSLLAACGKDAPASPQSTPPETTPTVTTPAPTTPAPTTPAPTTPAPTTPEPTTAPQVMDLVGIWQRTHTEVEGDRTPNTNAMITISGNSQSSLTITYKDKEFPETDFADKALTLWDGELFPGCGNSGWYLEAVPTEQESYYLTLLEDGTLLVQCVFEFDGFPMVSTQWFTPGQ